jgi:hypothetical protein
MPSTVDRGAPPRAGSLPSAFSSAFTLGHEKWTCSSVNLNSSGGSRCLSGSFGEESFCTAEPVTLRP